MLRPLKKRPAWPQYLPELFEKLMSFLCCHSILSSYTWYYIIHLKLFCCHPYNFCDNDDVAVHKRSEFGENDPLRNRG